MKTSKWRERISRSKRELAAGRGGEVQPRPVQLEPPFTPMDGSILHSPTRLAPDGTAPCELTFIRVRPSEEDRYTSDLAERLLVSLNPSYPVAFEILGSEGEVVVQFVTSAQDARNVLAQMEAFYPNCEAFESEDALQGLEDRIKLARCYRLRRSHLFALRHGEKAEAYTSLVGLLGGLGPAEVALFQVLFTPTRHNWQANILDVARHPFEPAKSAFPDVPQLPKKAEAKVSRRLFAVSVRTAASSVEFLDMIEGAFVSEFSGEENGLETL